MKAWLIDPEVRTVTEVAYDGDYKSIYKLIGAETFDVVRMDDGDGVYIDDEGLLKDPEFFFTLGGQPLAGKGLVLGSDGEGESVEPKVTLERLREMVRFKRLKVTGWEPIDEMVDHPVFGRVPMVGHRTLFGERDEVRNECDDHPSNRQCGL